MTIKFENPPINEVIIGVYFKQPIANFRSEHIGLLWSKLHKEFPNITQNPMLGPELFVDPEPYPMPRYWLTSSDETTLIQLQKTAFLFNWRKREASYPHYDHVKAKFDEHYAFFLQFIREIGISQEIKIGSCELVYINVIDKNTRWSSIEDSSKIIPSFKLINIGDNDSILKSFNYNISYQTSRGITLSADIKSAKKTNNPKEPALVMELRTVGNIEKGTKSEADNWFNRAHNSIIDCFVGMTNKTLQKDVWKLKKEDNNV
ncbi:MAG: TIGR04255 family protein [Chloroflexi bacterium]|nr:TIGR04255 family protein [Chloroflexota bacterium]